MLLLACFDEALAAYSAITSIAIAVIATIANFLVAHLVILLQVFSIGQSNDLPFLTAMYSQL